MTRFLIALFALLGLAAQAPACARVSSARAEVGLVAAPRVAVRTANAVVVALASRATARFAEPQRPDPAPRTGPLGALRAPVLPGIDRAHE
ncbi:hypothetical protein ACFOON_15050 [Novosphingobium piscinae]|uniref:Uncharacterized protein n=1 Tax=Novosphingobium piscinae TaxID=1507448 RepID=A0A7X1G1A3_9SPHN|nr:hypothetical protein [Novosphingobium piscinae]MBC2670659.1 hypothetical protein [Novosphingobium piscinae]